MKTYLPKPGEGDRKWYGIAADGQVLGRLAVQIANRLRGRHKPVYTPHVDTGDFIVVINAEKVVLTGNKEQKKIYQDYSGWMGGERYISMADMRAKKPEFIIEHAVKGMLPRNPLGRAMYKKLKVYRGAEHPHAAQQPQPLDV